MAKKGPRGAVYSGGLPPTTLRLFVWIFGSTMENGFQPTVREMSDELGSPSPAAAYHHIKTMMRQGYIMESRNHSRSLRFLKTPTGEKFRGFIHKPEGHDDGEEEA